MKVIPDALHDRLMALLDDLTAGRLVRPEAFRVGRPTAPEESTAWPWDGLEHRWTAASAPIVPLPARPDPVVTTDLPEAVQRASVALSYGSPEQITRNLEYARRALMRGEDQSDVIRALTDGEEL